MTWPSAQATIWALNNRIMHEQVREVTVTLEIQNPRHHIRLAQFVQKADVFQHCSFSIPPGVSCSLRAFRP